MEKAAQGSSIRTNKKEEQQFIEVLTATAFTPEKEGISCCLNYDHGNQVCMQEERFTLTKDLFSFLSWNNTRKQCNELTYSLWTKVAYKS